MADKDSGETPPLGETDRDLQVTWGKGFLSLVPGIGPIINTIIETTIPNQRTERIEAFLHHLSDRIDETEFTRSMETPEGLDLFEEGLWQAARGLSDERKQRIARLVAEGIKGEDASRQEARHFLRILNQIDDRQIVLLAEYLPENRPYVGEDKAVDFHRVNRDVLQPGHVVEDILDHEVREKAQEATQLNESMRTHLAAFGLLRVSSEDWNNQNQEFEITPLGRRFLEHIGLVG